METSTRLHPLLSTAAVSVIVLSVAGVGALTGVLPQSRGNTSAATDQKSLAQPLAPATTPAAAAPAPAPLVAAPAPQAQPVKKAVVRTSAPAAPKRAEPVAAQRPAYDEDEYDRYERYEREARGVEMRAEPRPAPVPVAQPVCLSCGTVESVREVATQGQGTGLGAVAGGVTGAIIGKQFGHGSGKTAMTILGAAGGAFAGHKIEEKVRSSQRWDVTVRLDDGSYRTVTLEQLPAWRSGDRVRVVNGALEPERV
jgi:outer membrane lipoprotein SlyB